MSVIAIATLMGATTGAAGAPPDGEGDAAGETVSVALAEGFGVESANPEEPDDSPSPKLDELGEGPPWPKPEELGDVPPWPKLDELGDGPPCPKLDELGDEPPCPKPDELGAG